MCWLIAASRDYDDILMLRNIGWKHFIADVGVGAYSGRKMNTYSGLK